MSTKAIPLQYKPQIGYTIGHAFQEALGLAWNKNRTVCFDFNGEAMTVHKRLSVPHLLQQWRERSDAKSRRYRDSKAGRDEKVRRQAEIAAKQQWINALIEILESSKSTVTDEDALMLWLKRFTSDADDVGVTFDTGRLADLFEAAGYVDGEHVGQPPAWFNTRQRLAEWTMGQAINCLRMGMPPHPIVGKFVDQYFAIEKEEVK